MRLTKQKRWSNNVHNNSVNFSAVSKKVETKVEKIAHKMLYDAHDVKEDYQLYITIQFTEYKGILFLSFSLKQSVQY